MKAAGTYVTVSTVGEKCRAFVPEPLPPDPPLLLNGSLSDWGLWRNFFMICHSEHLPS
jgi:hypothetical protein